MSRSISLILAGVAAAVVALEAEPHVTWRSGLVAAIAFLGAIGVPAIHDAGSTPAAPPAPAEPLTAMPPPSPPPAPTPPAAPAP